jgi:hypothetical protein
MVAAPHMGKQMPLLLEGLEHMFAAHWNVNVSEAFEVSESKKSPYKISRGCPLQNSSAFGTAPSSLTVKF